MPSGFRNKKEPTKHDLQLLNQQLKHDFSQASQHLGVMGQYSERMMVTCFNVLKLAHSKRREYEKLKDYGFDDVGIDDVNRTLELICDQVSEFAADWKETQTPGFIKADFKVQTEEILDGSEELSIPEKVACSVDLSSEENGTDVTAITFMNQDFISRTELDPQVDPDQKREVHRAALGIYRRMLKYQELVGDEAVDGDCKE